MRVIFLTGFLFAGLITCAQCDKGLLESKEYGWKKGTDALPGNLGKGIIKARAVVQQSAQIVQNLYPKLKGGEGLWHGYYSGIAPAKQPVSPYNAYMMFYPYLCINNTEKRGNGYTASVFISINGLGDIGSRIIINKKEYMLVRAVAPDPEGYYYFNSGSSYDTNTQEAWLLTAKDKFPFIFMTRGEYLSEMRVATTQKRDQVEKNLRGYYEKLVDSIDHYIKKGPAYLAEPAQVLNYITEFNGFAEGKKFADPGRSYIIKSLNPDYFTNSSGSATPLYMTVVIRHMKEYQPSRQFYEAVKRTPLLQQLSALLGK
ncbi:MAG: hypothetical protein HZA79_00025 [Sphingobacteriales bacterium]|nr:hypothetical protein [Sphingobacteriales bacterium]